MNHSILSQMYNQLNLADNSQWTLCWSTKTFAQFLFTIDSIIKISLANYNISLRSKPSCTSGIFHNFSALAPLPHDHQARNPYGNAY